MPTLLTTLIVTDEASGLTLGDLRELVAAAEGLPSGLPVFGRSGLPDSIWQDDPLRSLTVTSSPAVRLCCRCDADAVVAIDYVPYCAEHTPAADAEAA